MNPSPRSPGSGYASSYPDDEEASEEEEAENEDIEETGEIPKLTSITPAMYVPIPADFITRFTPPTTAEEHLQGSISTLNAHAAAVKANILALTKRECVRVVREVNAAGWRERERDPAAAATPPPPPERMGLRPEERKMMVANLEAPRGSGGGRGLAGRPNFEAWPARGLKEWKEVRLMGVVSRTMCELSGYERHVGSVRGGYEEKLRWEMGTGTESERERMGVEAMDVSGDGVRDDGGGEMRMDTGP
ncbi:hypothetical protein E4U43_002472 [Claviceps pusilla]|uniref:Uncharacterized protein n=1 Tax=Claviceps pusilla TaxID=123648 RepID=A0A9P7NHX5_9HYPO|nr:hypothetical protein E4U43_002472 [Claviceps pusilla]